MDAPRLQFSPECAVLIGLQGAGKTTFYQERLKATHRHVSKDNFRHARDRNARQAALVIEALAAGQSVAVDNTNPTPADRAPVVALARACGVRVVAYYFDVPLSACLARNRRREGRARVPDVAVVTTFRKMTRPTASEGFDRLYRVTLADDAFEVTTLMPDEPRPADRSRSGGEP